MQILFVRHEKTFGNSEGRYVGRTDEGLMPDSLERLKISKVGKYKPDRVFVSPMRRCIQTANALFPKVRTLVVEEDLKETDFGDFEYKNYNELNGNPDYQAWIDSNGTIAFPNGEAPEAFNARCCKAFEKCIRMSNFEEMTREPRIAIVAHGGTIMAILEKYEASHDFYKWQLKNGEAILARWENGELKVEGKNSCI